MEIDNGFMVPRKNLTVKIYGIESRRCLSSPYLMSFTIKNKRKAPLSEIESQVHKFSRMAIR